MIDFESSKLVAALPLEMRTICSRRG